MKIYLPKRFENPKNLIDVPSAWIGLEQILADVLERFNIQGNEALEFGVEYGYSTVALSNYFSYVVGVDHFKGDEHTGNGEVDVQKVIDMMPENVDLVLSDYLDFIKASIDNYNLIHVDIVHTYEDTFACGDWAMQHAQMVLFHDTKSFPGVYRAVNDLAEKYGVEFYNYPFHNGLGILCRNLLL